MERKLDSIIAAAIIAAIFAFSVWCVVRCFTGTAPTTPIVMESSKAAARAAREALRDSLLWEAERAAERAAEEGAYQGELDWPSDEDL